MRISYSSAALFLALFLSFQAHAHRHQGRPQVVTIYEEAPPVFVTATAAVPDRSNEGVVPEPVAQSDTVTPPQATPTPTPTQPANLFSEAPHPEPQPATTTPAAQGDEGAPGGRLTISVTNRYGTPLSIGVGSNSGCPTPDGNPQPTTIASAVSYTFPIGWAGRISVGKSMTGCNSLIEASYEPDWPRAIDVSYVDGYSVPITCSVDDTTLTGCNIELFDQGIACDQPLDNGACPNSARSLNYGPPPAFFAPCQGSAYTFPKDDIATNGGVTGLVISCCIGTSCPPPSLQKSQKRGLAGGSLSERETGLDRSVHVHQHQERHSLFAPRSHVHQLIQDAKMRR